MCSEWHNVEVNASGSEPLCGVAMEHVAVRHSARLPKLACNLDWNGSSESIEAGLSRLLSHYLAQFGLGLLFGQSISLSLRLGQSLGLSLRFGVLTDM